MAEGILFQPADGVDERTLAAAINAAYDDYYVPIYLTPSSLRDLVARESIRLSESVVALDGSRVVGMGLLGVRGLQGWIGGMGVIPSHRRRGIARRMMQLLLSRARALGLARVRLEVITRNEPAHRLYRELGFRELRQLYVISRDTRREVAVASSPPDGLAVAIRPAAELLPAITALPCPVPPWQREEHVIHDLLDRLTGLTLIDAAERKVIGGAIYQRRFDAFDLFCAAALNEAAGAALVEQIVSQAPRGFFSYLNIPEDDPLLPIFLSHGFIQTVAQYEMALQLNREIAL